MEKTGKETGVEHVAEADTVRIWCVYDKTRGDVESYHPSYAWTWERLARYAEFRPIGWDAAITEVQMKRFQSGQLPKRRAPAHVLDLPEVVAIGDQEYRHGPVLSRTEALPRLPTRIAPVWPIWPPGPATGPWSSN